jgi:hypothetical protein
MLLSFALRGLAPGLSSSSSLPIFPASSSGSRSPENADDRRSRFRRDEPIAALRMRNRKMPKKSPSLPSRGRDPVRGGAPPKREDFGRTDEGRRVRPDRREEVVSAAEDVVRHRVWEWGADP